MSRPAWYDPGVCFRCLGPECGDCCSGKSGPGAVWVTPQEMREIAALLGTAFDEFTRAHVRLVDGRYSLTEQANFDCVFYEAGKGCRVYAARPQQCRTYPFWGKVMRSAARWAEESRACPGIGADATRVEAAEIRRCLRLDRERPAEDE